MGFCDGSGISWTMRKQSASRSRQIAIPDGRSKLLRHNIGHFGANTCQFQQAGCPTNSAKDRVTLANCTITQTDKCLVAAVSTQHRLVADRQTDRHHLTASTASRRLRIQYPDV